jgi:hypothetical protein
MKHEAAATIRTGILSIERVCRAFLNDQPKLQNKNRIQNDECQIFAPPLLILSLSKDERLR